MWNLFKANLAQLKMIKNQQGSMLWTYIWSLLGIAVFFLIFFLLWAQVKGWFVKGH
jgi:hypothetical protein